MPPLRCAALLLGITVAAQQPARPPAPPADAAALRVLLASKEEAKVAWAGHRARAFVGPGVATVLLEALDTWQDEPIVCLHLLDGLLHKNARVPGARLLPMIDEPCSDTSIAAFVLLAREPKQNEAELLELFRRAPAGLDRNEQRALRTRAIGNLLCSQGTPGFARLAWEKTDFDLHVSVHGAGEHVQVIVRRAQRWVDRVPETPGFPPTPIWRLTRPPDPTEAFNSNGAELAPRTLLADGPQPVYCAYMDGDGRDLLLDDPRAPGDGIAWLQRLAGREDAPQLWRYLVFADPPTFLREVAAARTEVRDFLAALRRDLVAAKVMTENEAAALPTDVQVHLRDERKDKAKALPAVPR